MNGPRPAPGRPAGMRLFDAEGRRLYLTGEERRAFLAAAAEEALRLSAALDRHLAELEARVLETLQQANTAAKRVGRPQTAWLPTRELEGALVPLCAMRHPRW